MDKVIDNLPSGGVDDEQAVIICLQFPVGKFESKSALEAIFDLDDIINSVIETTGVGIYDGSEFCEGPEEESVTFYIYGSDATRIYNEVEPILMSLPDLPGSYIIKRYSNFQNPEEKVFL